VKPSAYPKYKAGGFSWLPQVPEHWQIQRPKTVAACRVSNVDKVPAEHEEPVRLCNYTDVYHNDAITLDMPLMETTATADEIKRFRLEAGDVVLTKDSEEWSDIAVPALVKEAAPNLVCGYHLAFVRPDTRRLNGAYLHRCLQAKAVNYQFQVAATGVTRYGLANSAIGNAWIVLPPPPEQRAIALFLDRETARLDGLVAQKEKLLALLEEKRASLITHAVTSGLNPHAPTKPSDIPWLGNIPKQWRVARLKHLCSRIVDCLHSTPNYSDDGEYPAIRTADVTPGVIHLEGAKRLDRTQYLIQTQRLIPEMGDIVYSREGERFGIAACVPSGVKLCVSQRMMHFRVRQGANSQFLMWQLNSKLVYSQALQYVFGATSPHVNVETIANYILTEPPLQEQNSIASFIGRETGKLDALSEKMLVAIAKLRERRTALISAAVTGQIDVRNWKPAA
jgi:type I restriction enzyme S subunit